MNILFRMMLLFAGALALDGCLKDDSPDPDPSATDKFAPGEGIVDYTGYTPLASRPVRVHYYIPRDGDATSMPILFVLPGQERNAADYLAAWHNEAASRHIMVFALEFPADSYTSAQYNEGGMFDGGVLLDPEQWSFAVVESVFDAIRNDTGSSRTTYDMWGHSAGAQFVHRYATFMPQVRLRRAVSANAGWYTLPDADTAYPYGLKGTPFASQAHLSAIFARDLAVHLGTADTGRSGLNTSERAEAQGPNRYSRGLYYMACAEQQCEAAGVPFIWSKTEVEGVAHEYAKMVAAGAAWLY